MPFTSPKFSKIDSDKQVKIGEKYEVNPVIVDNVEKNADGTEVISGHIGKKYAPKLRKIPLQWYNEINNILTKHPDGKRSFKKEEFLEYLFQLVEVKSNESKQ